MDEQIAERRAEGAIYRLWTNRWQDRGQKVLYMYKLDSSRLVELENGIKMKCKIQI